MAVTSAQDEKVVEPGAEESETVEEVSYLKRAHELIKVCPGAETRSERVARYKELLIAARSELKNVLPIEGDAAKVLIRRRILLLQFLIDNPTFEETYPCLDMTVLSWRDDKGYPKIVPFGLDKATFQMASHWQGRDTGTPLSLPGPMADMFADVYATFRKTVDAKDNKIGEITITTTFSAMIPAEARELIAKATPYFRHGLMRRPQIFLLCEVANWDEKILENDPLIVGYKAGRLWYIGAFDETPLEEYARQQFTTDPF